MIDALRAWSEHAALTTTAIHSPPGGQLRGVIYLDLVRAKSNSLNE
jgi:hypothetical protein